MQGLYTQDPRLEALKAYLPKGVPIESGIAKLDTVEIDYVQMGSPDDPTVLMVIGFSGSMLYWLTLASQLAQEGYHIVLYNHRGTGRCQNRLTNMDYSVEDLAQDGMELLSQLNVKQAHVLGASMGGLVAQVMAILYPNQVLSLGLFSTAINIESYTVKTLLCQPLLL